MKKNILFFGDYIPAKNYGSIATTEAMLKLTNGAIGNNNLKVVDHRSYYQNTPKEGWPPYIFSVKEQFPMRKKLKQILPELVIKMINKHRKKGISFIPYKLSLYEEYYNKMLDGDILQYERYLLDWADVVIFQGEGSLVHGVDEEGKYLQAGLYQLFLLWLSKIKYNHPTIIVNHTVDTGNLDADEIIKYLYPQLDFVAVREKMSLNTLHNLNVSNAQFIPDALFSYIPLSNWKPSIQLSDQIDFSKPYICIGDTSGILKNRYNYPVKWDIVAVYSDLIGKLKKFVPQIIFVDGYRGNYSEINKVIAKNKIGYVNLKNCSYHDLFYVLKNAELFISGRWHASILSIMANTPILLMGADSHKTKALYELLNYDGCCFEVSTLPIHIDDMVECAKKTIENKDNIKSVFAEKAKELSVLAKNNVSYLQKIL